MDFLSFKLFHDSIFETFFIRKANLIRSDKILLNSSVLILKLFIPKLNFSRKECQEQE